MLQAQNTQAKRSRALSGIIALIFSTLLMAGMAVGGTHAYLMSKTDTYVNTFISGLPDVGKLTIEGTKVLEGRTLAEGEFSFELYETNDRFEVGDNATPLQTIGNEADGSFTFSAIEYDEVGTHYYVVGEKVPSELDEDYSEYITYDKTQYRITVTVTEGDGAFVIDKQVIAFNPDMADGNTSADGDINSSSEDGMDAGINNTAADGEQETPSEGRSTGQSPEGHESDYTGTPADAIAFTNKFDSPDPTVVINGTKTLDGRDMEEGEFSFDLYDANTQYQVAAGAVPLQSASNSAMGGFGFAALSYSEPGVHHYVVREDASAALGGVTYDFAEYHLEVAVSADEATSMLSATAHIYAQDEDGNWVEMAVLAPNEQGVLENPDGKPYVAADPQNEKCAIGFVTFANVYKAKPASYDFVGEVDLIGRDMEEGEFLFTVEPETDGAPVPAVSSSGNSADGSFGFGSVEFTEPGEYHYLIKQDTSAALEDITYDESVHRVIVTVVDDGNGKLVASVVVLRNGVQVDDGAGVKYVNRYEKPGEGGDGPDGPGEDSDGPDSPEAPGESGDDGSSGGGSGETDTIPGGSGGALSQTGDTTLALAGILLAVAAVAVVVGVVAVRRLKRK